MKPAIDPARTAEDEATDEHLQSKPPQRDDAPLSAEDWTDENVPSWFARRPANEAVPVEQHESAAGAYRPLTQQQQLEAQEAYRRRLEERFRLAQQMAMAESDVPPHQAEPEPAPQSFPRRPVRSAVHASPLAYAAEFPAASTAQMRERPSPLGVSIPVALMLLSVTSAIGAAGGYVMANPGVARHMVPPALASLWPFGGNAAPQVAEAPPLKKQAPAARVTVADVQGDVNAPIPLSIAAAPAEGGAPIALKISGLPPDAYITKGRQVADGEWLLRAEDVNAAELVVKSAQEPELGLLVTALEAASGTPAAPAKSMRVALNLDAVPAPGLEPPPAAATPDPVIAPVNAPPEQLGPASVPKPVPTPDAFLKEEVASYVEKGDMLLKVGDIIAARQFYLRAYELKSADGAYGVARTYDPTVYRDLNVQGLKPDAGKAAEWYGKAAAQGHVQAQAALAQPPME